MSLYLKFIVIFKNLSHPLKLCLRPSRNDFVILYCGARGEGGEPNMLPTKYQPNRSSGSCKEVKTFFTVKGHDSHFDFRVMAILAILEQPSY